MSGNDPLLGGRPLSMLTGKTVSSVGMGLAQVGRGMSAIGQHIPKVVSGTVTSNYAELADTTVLLDTDPDQAVQARSVTFRFAAGTRVMCLQYPPRGLLILGPFSDSEATRILSLSRLRLRATEDVSLTSTGHPFQIGLDTGRHIAMDGNEIQARNLQLVPGAFQSAELSLNLMGGAVATGSTVEPGDHNADTGSDNTLRSTTSTTYVTASNTCNVTIPRPQSGAVLLVWSAQLDNTVAADTSSASFEIRDTNSGGTVRRSASDNSRIRSIGTVSDFRNGAFLVTALAGTSATLFIQLMLKSSDVGNTASMDSMSLGVMPVL